MNIACKLVVGAAASVLTPISIAFLLVISVAAGIIYVVLWVVGAMSVLVVSVWQWWHTMIMRIAELDRG